MTDAAVPVSTILSVYSRFNVDLTRYLIFAFPPLLILFSVSIDITCHPHHQNLKTFKNIFNGNFTNTIPVIY